MKKKMDDLRMLAMLWYGLPTVLVVFMIGGHLLGRW